MALTVCFLCDRSYLEQKNACPNCGCPNFFCDDATMPEAVRLLCEKLEREKHEKVEDLRRVARSLHLIEGNDDG